MGFPEAWKRTQPTNTESFRHCAPYKLPSLGTLQLATGETITLEADAVFTPQCPTTEQSQINADESGGVTSIADMRDPFHASITPQAYATGAATVIAWMLVIMLIITPRTFFVGGTSRQSGLMGRRGMIGGATGGGSVIGVGTRPWLQKVAALTVAVSLTLATADTFEIAERQYNEGFMDAMQLRDEVVSGMEIKVSRVISDVFLWLAQVQTLIRLFPRHKEKVIIKWVGFALILLDITFSSLNSFGPYNDKRNPRHFETAIPALSYLFQLSLSMLYAAWVMYYGVTKRRCAFYHPMMWNISLVALLSIVAILTPVVFFITDISNYTIAGWGDYFRWVGAAAASVIVWEWVERIEALEREERKDGILGREIYDGDEMLDTTPSHEITWPRSQRQSYPADDFKKDDDRGYGGGGVFTSGHMARLINTAHRFGRSRKQQSKTETSKKRTIHIPAPPAAHSRSQSAQRVDRSSRTYVPLESPQTPPPTVASPVSRTDTTSADSTVYAVRYHPVSESPPMQNQPVAIEERLRRADSHDGQRSEAAQPQQSDIDPEKGLEFTKDEETDRGRSRWNWQAVAAVNPFRRKARSPPPEVQRGRVIEPLVVEDVPLNIPQRNYTGLALKDRLGTFAAQQGEKFRSKKKKTAEEPVTNLPVTIIPAQPRGRTWSPEILQHQQPEGGSSSGGTQITRDLPHSDPPFGVESDTSAQATRSNNAPNRTSRIRFTPETFDPPSVRHQAELENRVPSQSSSSVALGDEVQESHSEASATPRPEEQANRSITSTPRHQSPTNHDR